MALVHAERAARLWSCRLVVAMMLSCGGLASCSARGTEEPALLVYAGAASKPVVEEVAAIYRRRTGIEVDVVFGGSGQVLAQMRLAREGDIYFPGSSDYMELAKRGGDVLPSSERIAAYLVPALAVQRGNPHGIRGLRDLLRPGLRIAIANPETVCVGAYAVEIVERNLDARERAAFRHNLVNYTESCEKTATAIALDMADAVLGWHVFEHWDPQRIETIPLARHEVPRIGYLPIAIAVFTKNPAAAAAFIDVLTGHEGQAVFAKYRYFATAAEAAAWIGEAKPVGGEYTVPDAWLSR